MNSSTGPQSVTTKDEDDSTTLAFTGTITVQRLLEIFSAVSDVFPRRTTASAAAPVAPIRAPVPTPHTLDQTHTLATPLAGTTTSTMPVGQPE
jgi:hypothetical protein